MTRTTVLGAVSMAALAVALGLSSPAVAARPAVDMAAVVVASQVEPRVGNRSALGDDASTQLVQRALGARGYPATVDGWYGSGTRDRYAQFQRAMGYSGLAANGIPGPTSLATLGRDRFTITHRVVVGGTHDRYGGERVNTRTKKMLAAADARLAWDIRLSQGSYNPGGVGRSAGTHDGGGAVDIRVATMSTTQRWQTVEALRTVGFAAWLRTPPTFDFHIHAVAIGDTDLSRAAADQVGDYSVGDAGLVGSGRDNTPRAYRVPFTWWERYAGR